MTKIKLIGALTMLFGILAITATPAAAKFRAVTNNATSGSSQLKANTSVALAINGTSELIIVSKAPDTWKIQDSKSEQRVTKEGDHLDQEINFENATVNGLPITINNPVVIQFVQTGATTSDVQISKNIEITIELDPGVICRVKIPASAANKQLTKVKDVNIEASKALEAEAELTRINAVSEPPEVCHLIGIEPTSSEGSLKAVSIEHGVIQV